MVLEHQEPLEGYDRRIGGSLGKGTHGGADGLVPDEYIPRDEWDYEVSTAAELVKRIQEDNVVVGLDQSVDEFNVDDYNNITPGKNAKLVGHYCNPDCIGRGPVIRKTHYDKCLFKTRQPFHMYGVSLRGPMRGYFDPRDRAEKKGLPESAWYTAGVWVMTQPNERTSNFVGCEFWGWTWAGAVLGAKNYETNARFYRCSFHECLMETMGYGATQFDGHAEFDLCFFDECRHAIAGFGYDSETCRIRRSVAGPGPYSGHVFDRHELTDANPVAGKWIRISDTTIMVDEDIGGYGQEGVKLRGRPEKLAWVRRCHFTNKDEKPVEPGEDGDAYLQEGDRWRNFLPEDNHFGPELKDGYGAPLANENNDNNNMKDSTEPPTVKMLTVEGHGPRTEYEIYVNGYSESADTGVENNDSVTKVDKNTYKIHGHIVGATDSYELAEGVYPTRAWTTGPATIEIDGKPIPVGSMVAADMQHRIEKLMQRVDGLKKGADSQTLNELKDRVEALSGKLESAHIEYK